MNDTPGPGPESSLAARKSALRQAVSAALAQLSPVERATASKSACTRLRAQAAWQEARSVLAYAPMPGELDIWPLIIEASGSGKRVALPRFDREAHGYHICEVSNLDLQIRPGHFGIREPAPECSRMPLNMLDFIMVPGVAFDLRGNRLGRGKAYYDRLLAGPRGKTCGIGFDQQIVPEVPVAPHDIQLDCILTPTRWIDLQTAWRF